MDHVRRRGPLLWALTALCAVAIGAATLEIAALAWYATRHSALYYTDARPALTHEDSRVDRLAHQIHPYFGFSVRPGTPGSRFAGPNSVEGSETDAPWLDLRSNNFGFYDRRDYPTADPDEFIVGIFGGSVAHSLAIRAGARLAEQLESAPLAAGREVVVLNFASGSYKQPQQVLILAYFLTLG